MIWRCRGLTFDLSERTLLMGVLNVTPDSFSDGGRYADPQAAIAHARELIAHGADIIDVGPESTRPGAPPVPDDEQWRRLAPVLEALTHEDVCISVDTSRADVAKRSLDAGAHVINDVTALGDPGVAGAVASAAAGLVLMHMLGTPETMQQSPHYDDVIEDIRGWLAARIEVAIGAGVAAECIAVDPGIGFGKTAGHNLELLARMRDLESLGRPILIGVSRKSFIGRVLDRPVDQRLEGALAATAVAVFEGARVVRTHDVRETKQAIRMAAALREAGRHPSTT